MKPSVIPPSGDTHSDDSEGALWMPQGCGRLYLLLWPPPAQNHHRCLCLFGAWGGSDVVLCRLSELVTHWLPVVQKG